MNSNYIYSTTTRSLGNKNNAINFKKGLKEL